MVSPIRDESGGPAGMPVYGFEPEPLSKNRTKGSLIPLNNIMMGMTRTFKVLKSNENKPFRSSENFRCYANRKTENFKALENQNFIRGASVGVTAQIVPYIKPEK